MRRLDGEHEVLGKTIEVPFNRLVKGFGRLICPLTDVRGYKNGVCVHNIAQFSLPKRKRAGTESLRTCTAYR